MSVLMDHAVAVPHLPRSWTSGWERRCEGVTLRRLEALRRSFHIVAVPADLVIGRESGKP